MSVPRRSVRIMTTVETAPRQVALLGGAPVLLAHDSDEWEAWLAAHYEEPAGAWLLIAKKNSGAVTVTQPDALDGALCFGWIDSVRRSFDDTYYLQRYSPRRRGSAWSAVNAERPRALSADGRMREPGRTAVQRAKATGRFPGLD